MGNNVSEGAIVQHLAKLRNRRVAADKQVPPPLRRGGCGSASKASGSSPALQNSAARESTRTSPQASSTKASTQTPSKAPSLKLKAKTRKAETALERDDFSESSDEEYGARRVAKKSAPNMSGKRRKLVYSDSDADTENDGNTADAEPDEEMVAVGAQFLRFPNDDKESSPDTAASKEADDQEKPSKIVTLRYGSRIPKLLPIDSITLNDESTICDDNTKVGLVPGKTYHGIGAHHIRDRTKTWTIPPAGPDNIEWGFSRDYYGPIPMNWDHPMKPWLIRGQWPKDVILRQYECPDVMPGQEELDDEPDPKIIHPATWIEDRVNCEPELLFHRKLRQFREDDRLELREEAKKRDDYQKYVTDHRELPSFFDPTWNAPPTMRVTRPQDDMKMHTYLSGETVEPGETELAEHRPEAKSRILIQLDPEVTASAMLDMNNITKIHDEFDRRHDWPSGKCYNLSEEIEECGGVAFVEKLSYGIWHLD